MCKCLNISNSSTRYKTLLDNKDAELKDKILNVLKIHPAYGHRRISIELDIEKKRIRRVMKKYNIKPYRRRSQRPFKKDDINKPKASHKNLIKDICPITPHYIYVSDFTYIPFQSKYIYLATIMDLYTRVIVGWYIAKHHETSLVIGAFNNTLKNTGNKIPKIIHSDQGSEYDSIEYKTCLINYGIEISMSNKSSPWENGYQESFYSNFDLDLGDTGRFKNYEELIENINVSMYYYNRLVPL